MKRLKIYIETSLWNFLITKDSPHKREITEQFFKEISEGKYEIFISDFVVDEINRASERKRSDMRELIQKYEPARLSIPDVPLFITTTSQIFLKPPSAASSAQATPSSHPCKPPPSPPQDD